MATIELLGAAGALGARAELVAVYLAAFAPPPYAKTPAAAERFAGVFERHAGRAGFRLAAAREGGRLAGFGYGYDGEPGQWWHDTVADALGPALAERWLRGCFELVELAVLPADQGRGIGAALHDALLAGLPNPTAALSTIAEETAGLRLYRRRGWQVLHPALRFPGVADPYTIMGLDLGPR
jgi:ribosomal protein S18 acetylase RimI-like enzyme